MWGGWLAALALLASPAQAALHIEVGAQQLNANQTAPQFIDLFVVNDGAPVALGSLDFAIQIGDGLGATPSIDSVDLITGTVFEANNNGQFALGANQPQRQYHAVLKGGVGAGAGPLLPNGTSKLATVGIVTAGASAGGFTLSLSGTDFGDTDYVEDLAAPQQLGTTILNGQLTLAAPPPTAARVAWFSAQRGSDGVVRVGWETLVEVQVLGFRVERAGAGASWEQVGEGLIPAEGQVRGARYEAIDRGAPAEGLVRYRLLEVDLRGAEHVRAETSLRGSVTTRLVWSGSELRMEVSGRPGVVTVIEAAGQVMGPWVRLGEVRFEDQDVVALKVEVDPREPMRFYRAREQE